jgi:MFS family permease
MDYSTTPPNSSENELAKALKTELKKLQLERMNFLKGVSTIIGGFFILCCVSTMYGGFTNIYEASYFYNNTKNPQAPNVINFTMSINGLVTPIAYSICVGLALKLGERTNIFIFSFLNCVATFLTPYCSSNMYLYALNRGVNQALFAGIPYFIPVLIGWTYFPKRKGLVTSLIMMGYSMSSYIIGSVVSGVVNPANSEPDEIVNNGKGSIKLYGPEVTKNVPRMWFVIAGINFALLLAGMVFLRRPLLDKNTKRLNSKSSMGRSYIEPVYEGNTPGRSALEESLVSVRTDSKENSDLPPIQEEKSSVRSRKSTRSQKKTARGSRVNSRGQRSMNKSEGRGRSLLTRSMSDQQYNFWRRALFSCDLYPLVLMITTGLQFPMFFARNFHDFRQ